MGRIQNKMVFLILLLLPFNFVAQRRDSIYFYNSELKKKAVEFKNQAYFNKALSFFLMENSDSTLVYTMKQLNIKNIPQELKDYCHYFRGVIFKNKKLFKQAKNEFSQVSDSFHFHYLIVIFIGEIALEQKDYQKALTYFETIEKKQNPNYNFIKSALYHNIGLCYFHTNQFDKAELYLFKAAKLQEIEKNNLNLIGSYTDIANLYYEQYKDDKAISYFNKAYQLSKKVKDFELKQNAAMNMAVVEENRKNLSQALVYRKEYEKWKDSLNDQNKIWAVAQIEKKYAINQKQKEITLLEAENKVKRAERNGFLYASISLLTLLVTGGYFYKQKIKRNKVIQLQKEELDILNATKDKLFSVVSHDLRSSVVALKNSNLKLLENLESKNYSDLDKQVQHNNHIATTTYNLLDNLLNWAMLQTRQAYFYQESQNLFSLVQQVAYNYKPLMIDKNIDFKTNISTDVLVFVDGDSFKLILRNLLDNAIKFSKPNQTIAIYTLPLNDDFCNLVIEDSGLGMDEETKQELLKESSLLSKKRNNESVGTGLGMQLCKSMIKKNGGKIAIESQENKGTKVIVSLPKK